MQRYGIFVDAGYLYAASGALLFATTHRPRLVADLDAITGALCDLAASRCTGPDREHLRTYWYDSARDRVATPEQEIVALRDGMKLRLGRLTLNGQKGVDSRIVRDLIVLSTERAITDAFLLAGDEDLREGVTEAQERGVRVTLIGIEPLPGESNMSTVLAMEADDVVILTREQIEPWITLRSDPASAPPERLAEDELVDVSAQSRSAPREGGATTPTRPDPELVGAQFAHDLVADHGVAVARMLMKVVPKTIPPEIDARLLAYASVVLSQYEVDPGDRRAMRQGFWSAIGLASEE